MASSRASMRSRQARTSSSEVIFFSAMSWAAFVADSSLRRMVAFSRAQTSMRDDAPLNGFAPPIDEGPLVRPVHIDLLRGRPRRFFEGDRVLVGRQPVMLRPVEGGESLQLVEGALLLEHLRVDFDGYRRVEQTGGPDHRQLLGDRVRGRIGAQKIAGLAGGGRLAQGLAVAL